MQHKITYRNNLSIISFATMIIFMGCGTSHKSKMDCHPFGIFEVCLKDSKKYVGKAIDGELGSLKSNLLTVDYDYSTAAYSGPQDEEEYFHQAFRSIHYLKYFDSLYIDKKVQKLFRDSVTLQDLKIIKLGSAAKCKACNREAILAFKNIKKPFYYFVTDDLALTLKSSEISYDTINNTTIKFYKNPQESGAYLKETRGNRQTKKLSLKLISGDFDVFRKTVLTSNGFK